MAKNKNQTRSQRRRQRREHKNPHQAFKPPAPFLHKERVVFEDAISVASSASGYLSAVLSANGAFINNSGLITVPQSRLWTQYAGMYDYYQVKHISFRWIPYRFQGQEATTLAIVQPTVSIIDPDNTYPQVGGSGATFGQLFSFGNGKIVKPYDVHHRCMSDYTNLGVQKQDTIIKKTNGTVLARELYDNPATLVFSTYGVNFTTTLMGEFVYKIEYEFSGMKAPGLSLVPIPPAPVKVQQPQSVDTTARTTYSLTEQIAMLQEKLALE